MRQLIWTRYDMFSQVSGRHVLIAAEFLAVEHFINTGLTWTEATSFTSNHPEFCWPLLKVDPEHSWTH